MSAEAPKPQERVDPIESARRLFTEELLNPDCKPAVLISNLMKYQNALLAGTQRNKAYVELRSIAGLAVEKTKLIGDEMAEATLSELQKGYHLALGDDSSTSSGVIQGKPLTLDQIERMGEQILGENRFCTEQVEILAKLYASEIGMTKEEYKATLPRFKEDPVVNTETVTFSLPVIVETRVNPWRQLQLLGIHNKPSLLSEWEKRLSEASGEKLEDYNEFNVIAQSHRISENPYVTFVDLIDSPYAATASLNTRNNERGGTIFDLLSLFSGYREFIEKLLYAQPRSEARTLVAPGKDFTLEDEEHIYVLDAYNGRPWMHGILVEIPQHRGLVLACLEERSTV